jgi:lysophospholipase
MVTGLYLLASTLILGKAKVDATTLNVTRQRDYPYIPESTYKKQMRTEVEPALAALRKTGTLTTSKDISIYYETYEITEPLGHIVISHGFTEAPEKYYELIYYFTQSGYSVYIPTHQGHGHSTRLVDDLSLVHIRSFDDYIIDLTCFIEDIVLPNVKDRENLYLFGHSMGGGIATLYLQQNPDIVDAAILSSPMLEVEIGNMPSFLAQTLTSTASLFGQKEKYVLGHGPFDPDFALEEGVTHSSVRYEYYFNKKTKDEYLQTNGASFNWVKEALKMTPRMVSSASRIDIPILLFQAEEDTLVRPGGQVEFAQNAQNCELVIVPEGKHDLFLETDKLLFPYLHYLFNFLDEHNPERD